MTQRCLQKFSTVCICVLIAFFGVRSAHAAKSYRITGVSIDAQLRPDGSMEVKESRTFEFSGSFSYIFRTLSAQGRVTFQDFKVSENGKFYELSDSGRPGTYRITSPSGQTEVRWFFDARDESRTFDFHYRVLNAVTPYDDAAVLYYQFLSQEWDRVSRDVRLQVSPPRPISKSQLNEWLHGPLWAESRIEEDGSITAWCARLPSRTYLEIRALYPIEIFPDAQRLPGSVRNRIMQEEAHWAEESNRMREEAAQRDKTREKRQAQGKWIVIVLSVLGLGFAWRNFRKYGQRPSLPPSVKYVSDVPENIPPALVGYLLSSREIYGGALVSTMMDLACRGFIKLREEHEEKKRLFGGTKTETLYVWELNRVHRQEHAQSLEDYEGDLLRFIFDDLAEGRDSIDLKEIKKQQTKFTKFFREWKKTVKRHGEERNWFNKESLKGMYYSLAAGIIMMILTGVAAYFVGIWAIVMGVASVAVFVLCFLTPHRTQEGERLARHWKALKRYLQKYHYRSMDKGSLLHRIDEYFVYGVVLGLGEKIFKELAAAIPAEEYQRYIPWYVYRGTGTGSFSPDAFASAFSTMVVTATSSMSTASGTGGGASAGGGGGASSGGGGAG